MKYKKIISFFGEITYGNYWQEFWEKPNYQKLKHVPNQAFRTLILIVWAAGSVEPFLVSIIHNLVKFFNWISVQLTFMLSMSNPRIEPSSEIRWLVLNEDSHQIKRRSCVMKPRTVYNDVKDWQMLCPQTVRNVAQVSDTQQRLLPTYIDSPLLLRRRDRIFMSYFPSVEIMITQRSLFPEVKPQKKQQKLRIIAYEHPP